MGVAALACRRAFCFNSLALISAAIPNAVSSQVSILSFSSVIELIDMTGN